MDKWGKVHNYTITNSAQQETLEQQTACKYQILVQRIQEYQIGQLWFDLEGKAYTEYARIVLYK